MSDKGIIFAAPMVCALLDGRKTQTRRLLKLPTKTHSGGPIYERPGMGGWAATTVGGDGSFYIDKASGKRVYPAERAAIWHQTTGACVAAPYAVGDRLYVRESWRVDAHYDDLKPSDLGGEEGVRYEADGAFGSWTFGPRKPGRIRPGMFMPRWASRLTLTITDVRVQRLQQCSEEDAIAEGVERNDDPRGTAWKSYETCPDGSPHPHAVVPNRSPLTSYRELWDSLHTKDGERWQDNPWVVAVSFDVHRGNIDGEGRS